MDQPPPTKWSSSGKPQLCVMQIGQTGDIPHVAAAAVLDDNTDILVISLNPDDMNSELIQYFKYVTDPGVGLMKRERVRFIAVKETEKYLKPVEGLYNMMTNTKTKVDLKKLVTLETNKAKELLPEMTQESMAKLLRWDAENPESVYQSLGVNAATRIIAEKWKEPEPATAVKYTLLAERTSYASLLLPIDSIIVGAELAGMQFPPATGNNPIVLLWSRYSGASTSTGNNPEGDSDLQGQEQLLGMIKTILPNIEAITIGHDKPSGVGVHSKYHLGERFFREGPVKVKGNGSRGAQVSFFLALMQRYPGRLYQLGQKSGGMDAAALVGIPTIYIEQKDSVAILRMEAWIGKLPCFDRALINEPPTTLGKALVCLNREVTKRQKNGVWNYPNSGNISADQKMPRDEWRRIAMLYQGLIPPFEAKDDLLFVTNTVSKATGDDKLKWDLLIQALTPEKLALSQPRTPLFSGYTDVDLEGIKDALEGLIKRYNVSGTIYRDGNGKYVARI